MCTKCQNIKQPFDSRVHIHLCDSICQILCLRKKKLPELGALGRMAVRSAFRFRFDFLVVMQQVVEADAHGTLTYSV